MLLGTTDLRGQHMEHREQVEEVAEEEEASGLLQPVPLVSLSLTSHG